MDIFTVFITKIHSVTEGKHVVLVDCDTDCYGKTEHNKVVFHQHTWPRIKNTMKYLETEGMNASSYEYYEQMTDENYYQRYTRTLKEYTDEELVEEINRRTSSTLFHNIGFEVKAVIKNRR